MDISIEEYQELSKKTLNVKLSDIEIIGNMGMGLAGESGEVVDLIKKHLYQGHALNVSKVEEELGDIMFYIVNLCNILGIDMVDVLQRNRDKLDKRYPEGFEIDKSVNRIRD